MKQKNKDISDLIQKIPFSEKKMGDGEKFGKKIGFYNKNNSSKPYIHNGNYVASQNYSGFNSGFKPQIFSVNYENDSAMNTCDCAPSGGQCPYCS